MSNNKATNDGVDVNGVHLKMNAETANKTMPQGAVQINKEAEKDTDTDTDGQKGTDDAVAQNTNEAKVQLNDTRNDEKENLTSTRVDLTKPDRINLSTRAISDWLKQNGHKLSEKMRDTFAKFKDAKNPSQRQTLMKQIKKYMKDENLKYDPPIPLHKNVRAPVLKTVSSAVSNPQSRLGSNFLTEVKRPTSVTYSQNECLNLNNLLEHGRRYEGNIIRIQEEVQDRYKQQELLSKADVGVRPRAGIDSMSSSGAITNHTDVREIKKKLERKKLELSKVKDVDSKYYDDVIKRDQGYLDKAEMELININDEIEKINRVKNRDRNKNESFSEADYRLKLHAKKEKENTIENLRKDIRDKEKKRFDYSNGLSTRDILGREIRELESQLMTVETGNEIIKHLYEVTEKMRNLRRQSEKAIRDLELSVQNCSTFSANAALSRLSQLNDEASQLKSNLIRTWSIPNDDIKDIKGKLDTLDKTDPYNLNKWKIELDRMERKLEERYIEVEKAHKCLGPLEFIGEKFSPRFKGIVIDRLNLKFDNLESTLESVEKSIIQDFKRLTDGFASQFENDMKRRRIISKTTKEQKADDVSVRAHAVRMDDLERQKERAIEKIVAKFEKDQVEKGRERMIDHYQQMSEKEATRDLKMQLQNALAAPDHVIPEHLRHAESKELQVAIEQLKLAALRYLQEINRQLKELKNNNGSTQLTNNRQKNSLLIEGRKILDDLDSISSVQKKDIYRDIASKTLSGNEDKEEELETYIQKLETNLNQDNMSMTSGNSQKINSTALEPSENYQNALAQYLDAEIEQTNKYVQYMLDQLEEAYKVEDHIDRLSILISLRNAFESAVHIAENTNRIPDENVNKAKQKYEEITDMIQYVKVEQSVIEAEAYLDSQIEKVKQDVGTFLGNNESNAGHVYMNDVYTLNTSLKETVNSLFENLQSANGSETQESSQMMSNVNDLVKKFSAQQESLKKKEEERRKDLNDASIDFTKRHRLGIAINQNEFFKNRFIEILKTLKSYTEKREKVRGFEVLKQNINGSIDNTTLNRLNTRDKWQELYNQYSDGKKGIMRQWYRTLKGIFPSFDKPKDPNNVLTEVYDRYVIAKNKETRLQEASNQITNAIQGIRDEMSGIEDKLRESLKLVEEQLHLYQKLIHENQRSMDTANHLLQEFQKRVSNNHSSQNFSDSIEYFTERLMDKEIDQSLQAYIYKSFLQPVETAHSKLLVKKKEVEELEGKLQVHEEEIETLIGEVIQSKITNLERNGNEDVANQYRVGINDAEAAVIVAEKKANEAETNANELIAKANELIAKQETQEGSHTQEGKAKALKEIEASRILANTMKAEAARAEMEARKKAVAGLQVNRKILQIIQSENRNDFSKAKEASEPSARLLEDARHLRNQLEESIEATKTWIEGHTQDSLLPPFPPDAQVNSNNYQGRSSELPPALLQEILQVQQQYDYSISQGKDLVDRNTLNDKKPADSSSDPGTIKYDKYREKSLFKNFYATLDIAKTFVMGYRQRHFDFLTKMTRRKFKYLNKWRRNEELKAGLQAYKKEIEAIEARMSTLSRRATSFLEDKFLGTFNAQLRMFDLRFVAYPEDRLKLIQRANIVRNTMNEINDQITTYYNYKITLLDIVSDRQFLMAYLLKALNFGIFYGALILSERIFINHYVTEVYTFGKKAPALAIFPVLVIGMLTAINLVVLSGLILLAFMYKNSTNLFIVDRYLIKGYIKDTLVNSAFVLLVSTLMSVVLQNKEYYRYHTEGPRAARIMKTSMLYTMLISIMIPFFYYV